MEMLTSREVFGDQVSLRKTHEKHLFGLTERTKSAKDAPGTFGEVLGKALADVNPLQHEVTALSEKMITDPESVNAHDVTIAMAKANMALSISKAVVDKALRAYQEIMNVR